MFLHGGGGYTGVTYARVTNHLAHMFVVHGYQWAVPGLLSS